MGDHKEDMQKPGYGSSDPSKQHESGNKGSGTSQQGERAGQSQQDKPGQNQTQNPGNRESQEKDRASNPQSDQGEKNRGSSHPGGTSGSESDRNR